MTSPTPADAPRPARRLLTIRARLTLSYAGLITASGAALTALVYLYMTFVPSYRVVDDAGEPIGSTLQPTQRGSVSLATAEDFLANLLAGAGFALTLLAVLGGVVGWIVAGRIIRPLAEIGAAARRAADGSLGHRVTLDGPRDEIRDLADTFDGMLDSLESSFAAQRRFTANASHELQSPLATTRTMIEVALADPATDAAELRRLVERIRVVNEGSIETIGALLDLAMAERGVGEVAAVDLGEVARRVADDLASEARRAGVRVEEPVGAATASAIPVLVRQAVSNLLRNAIRHNRAGGWVRVELTTPPGLARLTMTNSGAELSAEEIEVLREPFSRGSGRALTRGAGHGLGLALVDAAVGASGGSLVLSPNPGGGLVAVVELPADDPEPPRRT